MWSFIRRHPVATTVIFSVVAIAIAAWVAVIIWAARLRSTADELAAAGAVFAGGAFTLTAVGGVLAAAAFALSLRRPALQVRVRLQQHRPSGAWLTAGPPPRPPLHVTNAQQSTNLPIWHDGGMLPMCRVQVSLGNNGDATARNVTVILEIAGVQVFDFPRLKSGWTLIERNPLLGYLRLAWDGGTDLAVHPTGGINRFVPNVVLYTTAARPGSTIQVAATVLADGAQKANDVFTVQVLGD